MPRLPFYSSDQFQFAPCLLAGLSGLGLALAFPRLQLWPLVFLGLIPLLYAADGRRLKSAFWLGFLTGWIFAVISLYWLVHVLTFYGGLPLILAYPAFFLLTGYVALYTGLFTLGLAMAETSLRLKSGGFFWILTGAALYTGLEYLKGIILSGFPWEPLGSALIACLPLAQLADITGTGGLTFAVVLINLSLFTLIRRLRAGNLAGGLRPLAIIVIALAVLWSYGVFRLKEVRQTASTAPTRTIAIAQGNIDQSIKWDRAFRVKTLITYQELTLAAAKKKPWLIVWPETAAPFYYGEEKPETEWAQSLSRQADSALLFGSPATEGPPGEESYYNRMYLLDKNSKLLGFYDKAHLVPYGEYVPFQRFFPFIGKLTQAAGSWTPGRKGKLLDFEDSSLGVMICYESLFPALARIQVRRGADLLVNPTNDAWYGRTSAPYQLLSLAALRAVENRRAIVRAANTGVSALIHPSGEVLKQTDIYTTSLLIGEAPLVRNKTVYTIIGDLFSQACFGSAIVVFLAGWIRRNAYVVRFKAKA